MAKSRVRIKASCGCGLIITGSAKDVINNIKDHSSDTGHGCEIHGTVISDVKPPRHVHTYRAPRELN